MSLTHKALNQIIGMRLSSFVGTVCFETIEKQVWIPCCHGYKLSAHIHYPSAQAKFPAIIVIPGGIESGQDCCDGGELSARELSAYGFIVIHYDPSGRGESEGEEDHWGKRHQDEMMDVLHFLESCEKVDRENIGILSFSIGNAIALGALARHSPAGVRYLFDWEGPSNRFNITKNDTYRPLKSFPTTNVSFWREREPNRFIGDIACGYFRYQAAVDHMQKSSTEHARELVNGAFRGKAPWCILNGKRLESPILSQKNVDGLWVKPWHNHKGRILQYLLDVSRGINR